MNERLLINMMSLEFALYHRHHRHIFVRRDEKPAARDPDRGAGEHVFGVVLLGAVAAVGALFADGIFQSVRDAGVERVDNAKSRTPDPDPVTPAPRRAIIPP
jgi:hypothetical protein